MTRNVLIKNRTPSSDVPYLFGLPKQKTTLLRRTSVLRSKTLAEAEFISAEHCDASGLPKRRRPFWEVRAERGHAEAARRAAHRRDGARGRVILIPAARCTAAKKGGGLLVEETSPFRTPRDNEGLSPLDPRTSYIKSTFQQPYENAAARRSRVCCGFQFGLLLAAAAALRRGYEAIIARP